MNPDPGGFVCFHPPLNVVGTLPTRGRGQTYPPSLGKGTRLVPQLLPLLCWALSIGVKPGFSSAQKRSSEDAAPVAQTHSPRP